MGKKKNPMKLILSYGKFGEIIDFGEVTESQAKELRRKIIGSFTKNSRFEEFEKSFRDITTIEELFKKG